VRARLRDIGVSIDPTLRVSAIRTFDELAEQQPNRA
jgi:hypothetical protein